MGGPENLHNLFRDRRILGLHVHTQHQAQAVEQRMPSQGDGTQVIRRAHRPGCIFTGCPTPARSLTLRLKIAQKPYIVWSLDPKALKYESLEPKGKGTFKP